MSRLIAAFAAVCAVLVGSASPAAAADVTWTFSDDMEKTADKWSATYGGSLGDCPKYIACDLPSVSSVSPDYARSGTHYGWLASVYDPDWMALGRYVRLPYGAKQCRASIWARLGNYHPETSAEISIDVIHAADWTYEATQAHGLSRSRNTTYRKFRTGVWDPTTRDVYVRLVVPGSGVRLIADDLAVTCQVPERRPVSQSDIPPIKIPVRP